MIELKSTMPGKKALFGDACKVLGEHGIEMGGNWDFDRGHFDAIMNQDSDDTMYMRMPFIVIDGMLDDENALIEFGTPFIIRHVLNMGLDDDDSPVLATVGLDQFQTPDNPDAPIIYSEKWVIEGEELLSKFSEDPIFIPPLTESL